jgi:ABC-type lipoprotein release transport system permease subunit
MNIEQSAMFLASSILVGLGIIVLIIVLLVINNLFSKFWKSMDVTTHIFPNSQFVQKGLNSRFIDTTEPIPEPKIEPTIEPGASTTRAKK